MRGDEDGFALIAVLMSLAVAAALALGALALSQAGANGGSGYAAEVEGGAAAEAAIALAAIRLADAEGAGLPRRVERLDWLGWQVMIRVEDEAAKIDINRAPRSLLHTTLARLDPPVGDMARAARAERRFVSIDDLAADLGLPADRLTALRQTLTVYGAEAPATSGYRSSLETYRIVATAHRGGRTIGRSAIVRLNPGFGDPFEWLERGADLSVTGS